MSHSSITLEMLSKALQTAYTHKGHPIELKKAEAIAYLILSIFGYEDTVTDNVLQYFDDYDYGRPTSNNPVRSLFYMLEDDTKILKGSSEEIILNNGKDWRIFYWRLDKKKIEMYSKARIKEEQNVEKTYQEIFEKHEDEIGSIIKQASSASAINGANI